ncbi:MAG TPA: 4-(cytidine 5'-diphospho)-2-C-methyl-D-erythritol kinase [Firmicutes bacterium]|nr:4-(cytidine 5'-diphospho)-2-C-methyl-D-erythritol kinase [Bacillota bacterium]
MRVVATAPAKINLTLDMVGRREDGYHLVRTVLQGLSLRESVTVWEEKEPGVRLSVVGAAVPADERNTAWKAAAVFRRETGHALPGLGIRVHKRVPVGAGLAGGSADAAAVLAALDRLAGTHLRTDELCGLGAQVGADVPFCLLGGTAVGTGTGTILSPLPDLPDCWVAVAKPPESISTAEAYRRIDGAPDLPVSRSAAMEAAVCSGDLTAVGRELSNAFDAVTALSGVEEIKRVMRAHRTLGCQMTGSGSAVFGLFDDRADAERCVQALRVRWADAFLCRPDPAGARVEG